MPVKFDGKALQFKANGKDESFALKELQSIAYPGIAKLPEKFDLIELTDGSTIYIQQWKISKKEFQLQSGVTESAPEFSLPLNTVFYVLRNGENKAFVQSWKKLLDARGKRDLFVSRAASGDLSPLPGTVIEGSSDGESVSFEREDGQRTNFPIRRATGGIIFNPPSQGIVPPTIGQVGDIFGNNFFIQSMDFEGEKVKIKTVHGATIVYPNGKLLTKFDFSQGNITYISTLTPDVTAPKQIPGEPFFTYLNDVSQDNSAFRIGGVVYSKGVWIAPNTTLTYRLTNDFREFKAIVGIEDAIEISTSQIKLTIEGDGKSLFNGLITRKDKPKELVLDVKGVRELKISVSPSALFSGNQVTLAEARLQK